MLNFGIVENYQTEQMLLFPQAKINIGLYVTGKRDDGYHNISSLFFPLRLRDIIEIIPCDDKHITADKLSITGLPVPGSLSDNLILKACRYMRETNNLPFFKIHLHKIITIGAGLGGGSSNGASVLLALNQFCNPLNKPDKIKDIALSLGSDCPFFLNPTSQLAFGRGEELTEFQINLKDYWISIFNSGIHVSTKNAYEMVEIKTPEIPLSEALKMPIPGWKNTVENTFEKSVFKLHPEISALKQSLYKAGAVFAAMSGSGSSVYGIFKNKQEWSGPLKKAHLWTELIF